MELIKITNSNHIIYYNSNYKRYQIEYNTEIELPIDDTNKDTNSYWINKKINDLVGKYAIRSKPFIHKNGLVDFSYTDEILHIKQKENNGKFYFMQFFHDKIEHLNGEWDDGNWVEVPEYLFHGQNCQY